MDHFVCPVRDSFSDMQYCSANSMFGLHMNGEGHHEEMHGHTFSTPFGLHMDGESLHERMHGRTFSTPFVLHMNGEGLHEKMHGHTFSTPSYSMGYVHSGVLLPEEPQCPTPSFRMVDMNYTNYEGCREEALCPTSSSCMAKVLRPTASFWMEGVNYDDSPGEGEWMVSPPPSFAMVNVNYEDGPGERMVSPPPSFGMVNVNYEDSQGERMVSPPPSFGMVNVNYSPGERMVCPPPSFGMVNLNYEDSPGERMVSPLPSFGMVNYEPSFGMVNYEDSPGERMVSPLPSFGMVNVNYEDLNYQDGAEMLGPTLSLDIADVNFEGVQEGQACYDPFDYFFEPLSDTDSEQYSNPTLLVSTPLVDPTRLVSTPTLEAAEVDYPLLDLKDPLLSWIPEGYNTFQGPPAEVSSLTPESKYTFQSPHLENTPWSSRLECYSTFHTDLLEDQLSSSRPERYHPFPSPQLERTVSSSSLESFDMLRSPSLDNFLTSSRPEGNHTSESPQEGNSSSSSRPEKKHSFQSPTRQAFQPQMGSSWSSPTVTEEGRTRTAILNHPLYPLLVSAQIDSHKDGAGEDTLQRLSLQYQQFSSFGDSSQFGCDAELNSFMLPFEREMSWCRAHYEDFKNGMPGPKPELITGVPVQPLGVNQYERGQPPPVNPASSDVQPPSFNPGCTTDVYRNHALMEDATEHQKLKEPIKKRLQVRNLRGHCSTKRKHHKHSSLALQILHSWFYHHELWPYPTEEEKRELGDRTKLDPQQINNWFINQRKRHWAVSVQPDTTRVPEHKI